MEMEASVRPDRDCVVAEVGATAGDPVNSKDLPIVLT
jgi:hypothetical protein